MLFGICVQEMSQWVMSKVRSQEVNCIMLVGWSGHSESDVCNLASDTYSYANLLQFGFCVDSLSTVPVCARPCSPVVSEAPSALHWARLDSSGSRLSYIPGHKAWWLLALLKPLLLEPSMKWWWKLSTGSYSECVWLSMYQAECSQCTIGLVSLIMWVLPARVCCACPMHALWGWYKNVAFCRTQ